MIEKGRGMGSFGKKRRGGLLAVIAMMGMFLARIL